MAEQSLGQRRSLDLLADEAILILNAGSTVAAFGCLVREWRHHVITNNLSLLPTLADAPGIELIVLGGSLGATSISTVGPLAVEALGRMTADKVFMSTDGGVAERGLCEADLDRVALKSLMMRQAGEVVVLADATKISHSTQSAWARLPRRWTLVTDWRADAASCEVFAAADACVVCADG
jgi:DeoR/GlpR family transcriptional regulator of sugar metabolism